MTRRWLPYPILSVLLLIWLLLNQSIAPGTILLGALLGVALAKVFGLLRPPKARVTGRKPGLYGVLRGFARSAQGLAQAFRRPARPRSRRPRPRAPPRGPGWPRPDRPSRRASG